MLEELKKQVVKYALQADRSGLCKHRSGNFSVRDPKTGYVCITPTGMDREEMTYHDVVVIDLDANVIEAETAPGFNEIPLWETMSWLIPSTTSNWTCSISAGNWISRPARRRPRRSCSRTST